MQSPVFISHVKHAPLAASLVIGRTDELQKIADALDKGDDLLLLNGMGGVGKTTLAGFYMERYAHRYQHIAWISCSGDFRGDLVRQLNRQRIPGLPDTDNVPELFAAMLLSMEDMPGPNLLIADNLNTPAQIEDLAQYKPQFPRNWKMLITARCNTGAFPERAIGVLEDEEAKELFSRHYTFRAGDTEAQLQDLLRKVGRHTLAVEFIAKTLAQLPAWNLVRMLRHLNEKGLADLSTAATVTTAHSRDMRVLMEEYLYAIFEINLGAIGEKPRELLAQMAMFPAQPHLFPILCQVLGCAEEAEQDLLAAALNLLKNNGLLEDLAADGWYLHPLIQDVARQKWPLDYEDIESIVHKLDDRLDNWPLAKSLPLLNYATTLVEQLQFEDVRLALLCFRISDRLYDLGDYQASERFLLEANRLFEKSENLEYLGTSFERLGRLAKDQGKIDDALSFFAKGTALFEILYAANPYLESVKKGLAISYSKIGEISLSKNYLDEAKGYFEKYNQLIEELYASNPNSEGPKRDLAISYEKLGVIFQSQKKFDEAFRYFDKETILFEELYSANPNSEILKNGLAISYYKLGFILLIFRKFKEALWSFTKSNQLNEELFANNPQKASLWYGLATSYIWIGMTHREMGHPKLATPYFQKALPLLEQLCERTPIPLYLNQLEWVREALE